MNAQEKKLFLRITLPSLPKGTSEGLKGELLYGLKHGKIKEHLLEEAFPNEYSDLQEVMKQKPLFGFFDNTNYIFKYFFQYYNKKSKHKIVPAHLVGFKAERIRGKNHLKASVRLPNGDLKNVKLKMSPSIKIGDVNFNSYILIHYNTICQVLTETEYKEVVKEYFSI